MSTWDWLAVVVVFFAIVSLTRKVLLNRKGEEGIVRNIKRGYKGFETPVTFFEIHKSNGTIFCAGFDGHAYVDGLIEGALVRFWPTREIVVNELSPYNIKHKDGSVSIGRSRRYFYELHRILFLPSDVVVEDSKERSIFKA